MLSFLLTVAGLLIVISWALLVGVRSETIRTKLVLINLSLMVLGVTGLALYTITLASN